MQVAGHVLWPRAAWLYHGATSLMTCKLFSFRGFGFTAEQFNTKNLCSFYDILCQSFLWSMKQILVHKRRFRLLCSQSPSFELEVGPTERGRLGKLESFLRGNN